MTAPSLRSSYPVMMPLGCSGGLQLTSTDSGPVTFKGKVKGHIKQSYKTVGGASSVTTDSEALAVHPPLVHAHRTRRYDVCGRSGLLQERFKLLDVTLSAVGASTAAGGASRVVTFVRGLVVHPSDVQAVIE
ncbi:hypothetical protein EYF80_022616 [Liparis tanakae]|uniref:Uncharacterized protein n=1 Tax=Liparis tanakae TaxID=230148 RepID=A0A4Z2HMV3_9TELE|nr:hypothetical protein EYF80_022616 [Liparis tanakae]